MRELDTNNHSVFAMYYHLVLVIKYRRKVIVVIIEIKQDLKLLNCMKR